MFHISKRMNIGERRIEQVKYAQSQTIKNFTTPFLGKGLLGFALLPLASCQTSQGIFLSPPPAGSEPEFIEDPTNTFTARDNSDRFFEQKDTTDNLTVIGKAGDDKITTGLGDDVITGGAGNDALFGGDGNDSIDGEDGNDIIIGNDGDGILNGGTGNDLLNGALGIDTLNGGAGDDLLAFFDKPSSIDDQFDGGDGSDTLQIAPLDITTIDILGMMFLFGNKMGRLMIILMGVKGMTFYRFEHQIHFPPLTLQIWIWSILSIFFLRSVHMPYN